MPCFLRYNTCFELLVNRGGLKRKTAEDLLKGLQLSDGAFDALIKGV